jgi:hypothetical protein
MLDDAAIAKELASIDSWQPAGEPGPPLTDAAREQVHAMIAELAEQRASRRDAHGALIKRTAFQLGRNVARHQTTVADAARSLDQVIHRLDEESTTPIFLLQHSLATEIAEKAFGLGVLSERRAT